MAKVYVAPSKPDTVRLMATRRDWQAVQRGLNDRLAGVVALALQDRTPLVYVEVSAADAREIVRVAADVRVR